MTRAAPSGRLALRGRREAHVGKSSGRPLRTAKTNWSRGQFSWSTPPALGCACCRRNAGSAPGSAINPAE